MLASLVNSIEWRHSSDQGKTAVVMDDAVAEALKWNLSDTHLPANCMLLSLAIDAGTLSQLSSNDVSRYLVFTSKLSNSVGLTISHMLRASSAAECCILSSVSPEAAEFTPFTSVSLSSVDTGSGYEGLQMMLAPVKARVTYFPFHAIQIIASNPPLQPDQVRIFHPSLSCLLQCKTPSIIETRWLHHRFSRYHFVFHTCFLCTANPSPRSCNHIGEPGRAGRSLQPHRCAPHPLCIE